MKKLSLSARCLCGGVKIKTKGLHRNVSNCHCVDCRRTHGTFAAYIRIEKKNIRFLKKKTLKWFKSSKIAKRGFCNKCGASIFFKFDKEEYINISAGLFNVPTKLKTFRHIYVGSKSDYYKINDKLPKHKEFPK